MSDPAYEDEGMCEPHIAIQRISHELRTPLTVVIGFCDLLTDEQPDDASIREFATSISANAWQLHTAVERLIKELQNADYTGPPNHLALEWMPGPSLSSARSRYAGTNRARTPTAGRAHDR